MKNSFLIENNSNNVVFDMIENLKIINNHLILGKSNLIDTINLQVLSLNMKFKHREQVFKWGVFSDNPEEQEINAKSINLNETTLEGNWTYLIKDEVILTRDLPNSRYIKIQINPKISNENPIQTLIFEDEKEKYSIPADSIYNWSYT
jgi:hypothetical protein